ncbi:hypothetical protein PI125_g8508 [Phytophthora idaei]|nr:hypothetical protein PI125_g8508 [Phytophthora idaei]
MAPLGFTVFPVRLISPMPATREFRMKHSGNDMMVVVQPQLLRRNMSTARTRNLSTLSRLERVHCCTVLLRLLQFGDHEPSKVWCSAILPESFAAEYKAVAVYGKAVSAIVTCSTGCKRAGAAL